MPLSSVFSPSHTRPFGPRIPRVVRAGEAVEKVGLDVEEFAFLIATISIYSPRKEAVGSIARDIHCFRRFVSYRDARVQTWPPSPSR